LINDDLKGDKEDRSKSGVKTLNTCARVINNILKNPQEMKFRTLKKEVALIK
jgi:hypothetical protein